MNKKVLIVEDDKTLLGQLERAIKRAGFEVYTAGDVASARRLAETHWGELDVLLLDMKLDDPDYPGVTGARIAIDFRRTKSSFPPESLIYSKENEVNYYLLALELGAAAYLSKTNDGLVVVVRRVRVLALRRALNGENPEVAKEVARIAARSRTQSEAVLTFCRSILKREFEACLGANYVILFTDKDKTQNCADNAGLPPVSGDLYHTLQALAHGKGNVAEPFILETDELEPPADEEAARLYKKLNRAAFLPLSLSGDKSLSIGILQQEKTADQPEPPDAKALCTVLGQYLRPSVLENVLSIWSQWTELHATRNSTAKLCLSVGQEIKDSLDTKEMEPLEDLADDLNDTGQYLTQLDNRNWHEEGEPVSIEGAVEMAWDLVKRAEEEPTEGEEQPAEVKPKLRLDLRGSCTVHAQSSDVVMVLSRLLQWFIYRSNSIPKDVEPDLKIECESTNGVATITFEDNSHRLPKKLREDLFAPFTQAISTPFADIEGARKSVSGSETLKGYRLNSGRYLPLYLAKMLVEGRYRGLLEDHSDEIKDRTYGHRIVMQFPAATENG